MLQGSEIGAVTSGGPLSDAWARFPERGAATRDASRHADADATAVAILSEMKDPVALVELYVCADRSRELRARAVHGA
jgi:hypothetical protein